MSFARFLSVLRLIYDLWIQFSEYVNFDIFSIFQSAKSGRISAEFHLAGRISADRYYFCNQYTKITSRNFSVTMELHSRNHTQVFLKKYQNPIFTIKLAHTWSSSGWVPMVRKVLPSKSMSSFEHFQYSSCLHISHSSKDIHTFR